MLHAHAPAFFWIKGKGPWINGDTLGAAQMPGNWATPNSHGLGISKGSKNPELAWDFVKYLTDIEVATAFAKIASVLTGIKEVDKAQLARFQKDDPLAFQVLSTQLEHTDKMCGNWRLGNDSRVKDGFWPEFQSAHARPQGRQDGAGRRRAPRQPRAARGREALAGSAPSAERLAGHAHERHGVARSDDHDLVPAQADAGSRRWSSASCCRRWRSSSSTASCRWAGTPGCRCMPGRRSRPRSSIGLEHYEEMLLDDDVFWQALANTLIFIACSPLAIAAALGIALLVNSDLRGAAVYRTIVFLSYPLMTVAVGIIWRWLYDERGGFINYVLRSSGLVDQPVKFLQSFDWALPCVIVADFWQVLGFYMIILLTGLQSIPQHLYEAARVDGVPASARFFRITLPLLRPSIFLCIVVGILNSFTSFDLVYVMTNGGPGHATELLITYIYKAGFGQTRFDYAAALTVVQFLLLVVLTVLANRLSGGNAGSLER